MTAFRTDRAPGPFRLCFSFTVRHWRRQPWLAAGIALAMLLATLADVLVPLYAGRLIDAVAGGHGDEQALQDALTALGMILLLAASTLVLRHLGFLGIIRLTLRQMRDIAQDSFWRVQRLSTEWHSSSFAGSTVRKITRGIWALDMLNDTILVALMPSLVVLLGSTLLLGFSWPLVGLAVALGGALYVTMTTLGTLYYVAPSARLSNGWDTRMGGALADAIGCNPVVKAFGGEAREDRRLATLMRRWSRRTDRTWSRATNNGSAQALLLVLLRGLVIGLALLLWWQGRASAGDVAYVLTSWLVIQGYLRDIGMHVRNLQRSVSEMEELIELNLEPLGVADRPDATPIRIEQGEIRVERMGFRYGEHKTPLYDGLDLTIAAGERVGLVGHSGSGKTTFVKLVQRLHDVTAGRILIDGQDIAHAAQASLRAQLAIVPQEPVLFHRGLAENIAYGRPGASMAEIERAARLANAHDFIRHLPKGYQTLVGERGLKLSGGERQRVALARAFLADAPILILDEATSSLDSHSEGLIQEAIERLMVGRTTLVVAHRLSTLRAMDRILVFDRGRIVEQGSHRELMRAESGIYRRLFEHQAAGMTGGLAA